MVEEKTPQTFSDYVSKAIKGLQDSISLRKKKSREESKQTLDDLQLIVARCYRVKTFMSSPFWTNDLEPLLKTEDAKSSDTRWSIGEPYRPEEIASTVIFNSGKRSAIKSIFDHMRYWVEAGESANEKINWLEQTNEERRKGE